MSKYLQQQPDEQEKKSLQFGSVGILTEVKIAWTGRWSELLIDETLE
jgi:hypothetical protein